MNLQTFKFSLLLRKSKFILMCNIVGVIIITSYVYFKLEKEQYEIEKSLHEKTIWYLSLAFEQSLHPLQGIRAAFHYSNLEISSQAFLKLAESRDQFSNFESALGFGFIRRVRAKDLNSYIGKQRTFRKSFSLRRLKIPDSLTREESDLFIIEFVEPVERNTSAVGLVISDEKNRFEAALDSMKSGMPTLTRPIELVQSERKEPGFLFFLPIYKTARTPDDEESRRRELVGWAYAPLLASKISNFLKSHNALKLPFQISTPQISTGRVEQIVLFEDLNFKNDVNKGLPSFITEVSIAGQIWRVTSLARQQEYLKLNWIVGLIGLFLITLSGLFYYFSDLVKNMADFDSRLVAKSREEVKTTTAQLLEQKNFMQTVVDSLPVMVGFWDFNLRNKLSNKMYTKYFRKSSDEIYGIHLSELMPKDVFEKNLPFIEKALAGERQELERILIDSEDRKRNVLARYEPVWANNKVTGFSVVVIDITEIRTLEEEKKQTQAKLFASSKLSLLGEMAAGIAHEINNPLSIINGKSTVLGNLVKKCNLDNEEKEKMLANINTVHYTVKRMTTIINGLRSFSRDSETDPYLVVKISDIIESMLVLTSERLKARQILFSSKTQDIQASIFCNRTQIEQVFMNLISNSLDAIAELSDRWIEMEVYDFQNRWKIRIVDSGFGIKAEIVEKMMNPFFTTKEVGKGTGLGLSICRGIMDKHNASIDYELYNGHTSFVMSFTKAEMQPERKTG